MSDEDIYDDPPPKRHKAEHATESDRGMDEGVRMEEREQDEPVQADMIGYFNAAAEEPSMVRQRPHALAVTTAAGLLNSKHCGEVLARRPLTTALAHGARSPRANENCTGLAQIVGQLQGL
jgi:hypothetical protein